MAAAPNRSSQWDASDYGRNGAFVPALGLPVVELLAPRPGEAILDLGCGDGTLTQALVDAGARVTAVDASPAMVAAAKARGIDAEQADGEQLAFDGLFDAVFSNAALHWMLDGPAVARGVFRALKPGGRFVGEMGGAGNVQQLRGALNAELEAWGYALPKHDLQWYPTIKDFSAVYAALGFVAIDARLIDRPTPLPAGPEGWFRTFRSGLMDVLAVPTENRESIFTAAATRVPTAMQGEDGMWRADYVRLRFAMRKPD
ncbi:class I SAM-dependent methyltransferase [Sphingobium subterraneum]|uniref:SAM-dependent methyltransferase n=1 Tax=Sphingobium subterraneum TaxID=627688 RepID=A0A841IX90_9SPHN|nr:class I SAM-dependent methyltransferase [Sphingobium subterraneum]MBB6123569.1 SAM-dependent methyltransferase [Sphingobium subterraneum]